MVTADFFIGIFVGVILAIGMGLLIYMLMTNI